MNHAATLAVIETARRRAAEAARFARSSGGVLSAFREVCQGVVALANAEHGSPLNRAEQRVAARVLASLAWERAAHVPAGGKRDRRLADMRSPAIGQAVELVRAMMAADSTTPTATAIGRVLGLSSPIVTAHLHEMEDRHVA